MRPQMRMGIVSCSEIQNLSLNAVVLWPACLWCGEDPAWVANADRTAAASCAVDDGQARHAMLA